MSEFLEGLDEDVKAQLLRLKDLTRRTAIIYAEQELQLKLWPHMLFEATDTEAVVDIENKSVHYVCRIKGKPYTGKKLVERVAAMEGWLRTLLGDDWTVDMKYRQKKGGTPKPLFRGQRLKPLTEHEPAKTDNKNYEFKTALEKFRRYASLDPAKATEAIVDLPPFDMKKPEVKP